MTRFWSCAVAAAVVSAAATAQTAGPAARLGTYDDGIVAIMKQRLPLRARADRFEALVKAHYDMPAIAATVVGPAWASASAADRQAAIGALTRHSAVSLAQNFVKYSGEAFVIDPAMQDRNGSKIAKVTVQPGGDILYFRMRATGADWKIIDVISSGVSQLAVQRADLAATVASGGAGALAKRLAQVDAKALGGG